MEGLISATDQQSLISSFLEIAVGQTADTARQFLQATSWKLDEAIQLFFVGNDGGSTALPYSPQLDNNIPLTDLSSSGSGKDLDHQGVAQGDGDDVRPPLPVIREVLYDHTMLPGGSRMGGSGREAHSVVPFRNFNEELKHPDVWEGAPSSTPIAESSRDNLASLYRPPFALMYQGPFEKAKDFARVQNKWLLLNLQSTREFSSHMLNRDTWANEAISQTIKTNFIFWQIYNDTEEGSKVCTYYRLDTAPVTLVIDPVTGQKIRAWHGMIQPENLLEDLLPFLDSSPTDHHVSVAHKRPRVPPEQVKEKENEDNEMQPGVPASIAVVKDDDGVPSKSPTETILETNKPNYPPLPDEPTGDKNLLCKVGIRLPSGRRLQRNFSRSDPVQLLWSFCYSQLEEAETRPIRLTPAIPGSKPLDYDNNLTFEESGLANSMISVTWE